MKKLFIFCLMAMISSVVFLSYAEVPHLLNYQGRLTDSSGKPLEGAYPITFRLYDALSGGNLIWDEVQTVTVQKGVFNVLLGSTKDLNLTFDKPYYLELKVGDEVMSPRQRIASVGYSFRADTADNAVTAGTATKAVDADTVAGKTPDQLNMWRDGGTFIYPATAGNGYRINSNGDVTLSGKMAVGTTTAPTATLDVQGTFKASELTWFGNSAVFLKDGAITNVAMVAHPYLIPSDGMISLAFYHFYAQAKKENGKIYTRCWDDYRNRDSGWIEGQTAQVPGYNGVFGYACSAGVIVQSGVFGEEALSSWR